MPLTHGQRERFIQIVKDKGITCPICQSPTPEWNLLDLVHHAFFRLPEDDDDDLGIQAIYLSCVHCGYLAAFSAVQLGLLPHAQQRPHDA